MSTPGHRVTVEQRDGRDVTVYTPNWRDRTPAERDHEADRLLSWLRNGNPRASCGGPFLSPRHLFRVAAEAEPALEINWYRKDAEHPEPDVNIYDPESGYSFETRLIRGVIDWQSWEMDGPTEVPAGGTS